MALKIFIPGTYRIMHTATFTIVFDHIFFLFCCCPLDDSLVSTLTNAVYAAKHNFELPRINKTYVTFNYTYEATCKDKLAIKKSVSKKSGLGITNSIDTWAKFFATEIASFRE